MEENWLAARRVLVVEDEYFLAQDLTAALSQNGATILGPVASVADALALVSSSDTIDFAVLDVNLRGELSFPIADLLIERAIPFIFVTGYDGISIPDRFDSAPRREKPLDAGTLAEIVAKMM